MWAKTWACGQKRGQKFLRRSSPAYRPTRLLIWVQLMSATIFSMNPIHHITLSVSDLKQTSDWYLKLFGDAEVIHREGEGWHRVRLNWANGLVLSFAKHDQSIPTEKFSHLRIGLDHIGISCRDEVEVIDWFNKLEALQVEHGPIEDAPYGWAVTARDPDNIPVEFYCPK